MIAELATVALVSLNQLNSQGSGETAQCVTQMAEEQRRRLFTSLWNDFGIAGVFDQLHRVVSERSVPNWDGYSAEPVDQATGFVARSFLESLPLGLAAPSIGAEPDGQVTLEWYKSPRCTLSVSVDPTSVLHYAALIGPTAEYGTVPFFRETPERILNLIRRVSA